MLSAMQIDQLCDEFENSWLSTSPPDIISYINRFEDETTKKQVLESLLPLDLEYRNKANRMYSSEYINLLEQRIAELEDPHLLKILRESTSSTILPTNRANVIGPYKLLQLLGRGGMGEVWMAEQERPVRRQVAIKLIRAEVDCRAVSTRFEAEQQAIALMDHQNIAKFLEAGASQDGQPYFVMELVKGIPLTKFCDAQNLSIERRLELFVAVCNAVQHAHQKGIIHRDLKPNNILVALYDGKPVPKVIDFGLAKALQNQPKLTDKTLFTEFGQVLGTMQYMSPEQADLNQLDVDTRADIYSLGIILYELLTGSTPLDNESLRSRTMLRILEEIRDLEPPRPSIRLSSVSHQVASGISQQRAIELPHLKSLLQGDLDWIVMKAIDKNRSRRYETASGFSEDVKRFLNNDIVSARPPSKSYLFRKFVTKHRKLVTTVVSSLLLLALGLCGTCLMWYRAKIAESESAKFAFEQTKEAANARAFSKLLIDVFKSTDPLALEGSGFRDSSESVQSMTSVDLLKRVSRSVVDTEFPTPEAKVKALDGVGDALRGLGNANEAEMLLLEAERIQNHQSYVGHPTDRISLQFHLAILYHDMRDFNTANVYYSNALGLMDANRTDVVFRNQVEFRYAWLLAEELRETEAIQLFEKVRSDRIRVFGGDHVNTQVVELALILMKLKSGNSGSLLQSVQQLAFSNSKMVELVKGYIPVHLLRKAGFNSQAAESYEALLKVAKETLPPQHPLLGMLIGDMAGFYRSIGNTDRAIELAEQALQIARRTIPTHPYSLELYRELGSEYEDLGRLEDAKDIYTEIIKYLTDRNDSNLSQSKREFESALSRVQSVMDFK